MKKGLRLVAFGLACLAASGARAEIAVSIAYLEMAVERPPTLTNLDPVPPDLALAGARLGLEDNRTTGGFMGHDYTLEEVVVPVGGDWPAAARAVLARSTLVVVNAPAEALLALADLPEASGALVFNAAAEETALRDEACRANVLHTMASHDMRSDALAQFLVRKRWTDWVMIAGTHPPDLAFAEALRTSATKFGARLLAEKTWAFDADMRRNAAAEVPLFTQDFPAHHVLLVADEIDDFGDYIAYNTWEPRPVAGSSGASPRVWSDRVEAFGAAQLQGRFEKLAERRMRPADYAAWAAVRVIGEAVTRTGAADPATLRDFILSDAFELAAFKGAAVTFRDWNGQMRQPMPIAHEGALVAMAPVEGFLHQSNTLDTLGLDRAETGCAAFAP